MPRPQRGDRRREKAELQIDERGDIGGLLAPAGLRAPAQGTEARARRIHEDAVISPGLRAARSRPSSSLTSTIPGTAATALRTSPARAGTISFASSTAPKSRARRPRGAPSCPGACHRSSQRSPGRGTPQRERARATSCEPSSCTRSRPWDARMSASGSPPARRKPVGANSVGSAPGGRSARPGSAAIVTRGAALSARSRSRVHPHAPRPSARAAGPG